jgi:hypothetical protein
MRTQRTEPTREVKPAPMAPAKPSANMPQSSAPQTSEPPSVEVRSKPRALYANVRRKLAPGEVAKRPKPE